MKDGFGKGGEKANRQMISIIAPCLNEEKHLPVFFKSLANQTYQNFEVIIVDGGSTDKSIEIIKSYKNKLQLKIIVDNTPNFGYIRNLGTKQAVGDILFHLNTDNYLEPELLEKIADYYRGNREVVSVSGRVFPLGTSIVAHLGYQLFDLLRFMFTCAPFPIKKYRPSGNFMTIRKSMFNEIGGYPHATVNEDGLIGQKLDPYAKRNHKAVMFNLHFYVGHWVKKFESMGGINALMFYFYTLGNFAPMLQPLLEPIRLNASKVFQHKPTKQVTAKKLLVNFWNWL